jgi:hypothetical protein
MAADEPKYTPLWLFKTVVAAALAFLLSVLGYTYAVDAKVAAHCVEQAKETLTKSDLKDLKEDMTERFDKLEQKMDNKADKR